MFTSPTPEDFVAMATLDELIASRSEFRFELRKLIHENREEPIYQLELRIMDAVKERIVYIQKNLTCLGWFELEEKEYIGNQLL